MKINKLFFDGAQVNSMDEWSKIANIDSDLIEKEYSKEYLKQQEKIVYKDLLEDFDGSIKFEDIPEIRDMKIII